MTVNKITNAPTQNEVIDKINEVIDNLGGGGTAPVWGDITGTLSNQTDLQSALNDKYDASNPNGYTSNTGTVTSVNSVTPVSGNVTLTIPSDTSDLTNGAGYITSSALSGYANYNLSNITTTGKKTACGWLTPDYANGITVAASSSSEQSYTAPSIGWFNFTLWSQGNTIAYVMVNDYRYAIRGDNYGSGSTQYMIITGSILVNKSDVIKFRTSKSISTWGNYNYFYPAKGG